MAADVNSILEQLDVPCLLVSNGHVTLANPAARFLLGSHIVGENIRISLRNPAAVALVSSTKSGRIRLEGLSGSGSVWEMVCHSLDGEEQLITLNDISVGVGVARAHADFVANASHELRTPLAAILGYVETLGDPKLDSDPIVRTRFLETIRREAQRMQALIEDLMSLSRIQAGKYDPPDGLIDILAVARKAARECANPSRVAIDTSVSQAIVVGDSGQIEQVLRNLVDNALKYGKPEGPVVIAIETTDTGWVRLTVRDEGEGIAPEHLPRLTERFYRANASRSREAGGTGLGLSIVKHIVERHRGQLDISSRPGLGTVVSIMLRRAES